MTFHFRVVISQVQDAALLETGIDAERLVERPPQLQAFDTQLELAHVAMRDTHPAPVAAGLLTRYMSLLAYRDTQAFIAQIQRRTYADDPAADHDDIHFIRQGGVVGDGLDWWSHTLLFPGFSCVVQ